MYVKRTFVRDKRAYHTMYTNTIHPKNRQIATFNDID